MLFEESNTKSTRVVFFTFGCELSNEENRIQKVQTKINLELFLKEAYIYQSNVEICEGLMAKQKPSFTSSTVNNAKKNKTISLLLFLLG